MEALKAFIEVVGAMIFVAIVVVGALALVLHFAENGTAGSGGHDDIVNF